MDALQVLVLALLQGLTEFLPISSQAHLILVPVVADWPDQGYAFDVAVHIGTLVAVLGYFRRDLIDIAVDWTASLVSRRHTHNSRMGWFVIAATVPVGAAGLVVSLLGPEALRSPTIIAVATITFGLVLWWADRAGARRRGLGSLTWRDAMIVGFAQVLALIPGTSRSGITITAGLAIGLTRDGAARFSFLLSIPVIALAGMLTAAKAIASDQPTQWWALGVGAAISAVTAYLTIHFFLRLVERVGLVPFVVYRLLLGVALFALFGG